MKQAFLQYREAKENRQNPALLLFPRPILGTKRVCSLEVWDNKLYKNGKHCGTSLDLFNFLNVSPFSKGGRGIFPAWIGFFTYEFARHFNLPTRPPLPGIPEAAFYLYEEGCVIPDALWDPDRQDENSSHAKLGSLNLLGKPEDDKKRFVTAAQTIQEQIRAGDVYQVNLSQQFQFTHNHLSPIDVLETLYQSNPSPFMGLLEGDGWSLISGSPERLFKHNDGILSARPIAGTRPRGHTLEEDAANELELRTNQKELAEHTMLVDLLRNDLSIVSEPGSVYVSEAMTVERYSHVMHLVSEVCGKSNASLEQLMRAIFPGGTVTGAPKESSMQSIAQFESVSRGPYTGSLGYIAANGEIDFNILIRSLALVKNQGLFSAGAGVVIGSDAEREYEEVQQKAQSLKHVLGHAKVGQCPAPPVFQTSWHPPRASRMVKARVLFIECHDSFSFNIINYLRVLGCEVEVVDHWGSHPAPTPFSHMVIGPGPGDPWTSGKILEWVGVALQNSIPLLGICLGHQALGVYCGAKIARAERPIHGEAHAIFHCGNGLFRQVENPSQWARYNSLVLTDLPGCLTLDAWSENQEIMAISHKEKPAFGVQFHPESFASSGGLELLANFFELTRE